MEHEAARTEMGAPSFEHPIGQRVDIPRLATFQARSADARHVPSLDGMRSIAILLVLAVHSGVPGFASGWLGVDLFFTLSGFLITTLLLEEWRTTHSINLGAFWVRRFLRLMPAYYLYVGGVTLAIWFWSGSIVSTHGGWTPKEFTASLWAYFVNFLPMGGIWNGQTLTVHLWSLAVEEQYYVAWPMVLWLFLKFPQFVLPAAWAVVTGAIAYFMFFASDQERDVMLHARGISLFLASALALTLSQRGSSASWFWFSSGNANPFLTLALLGSFVVFTIAACGMMTGGALRHYLLPFLVLAYIAAVSRLWYGSTSGLWKLVLANPVLVYIGKISYGIYLYHEAVRVFIWWVTRTLFEGYSHYISYGIRLALYSMLSIALASASFHFYESRFLVLKRKFR